MSPKLFPHSRLALYGDYEIELVEDAAQSASLVAGIRDQVIDIAARSRGWSRPEDLAFFRRHFKIGPLFEAQALALVRRGRRLLGLAGSANSWPVAQGSIVHLCTLSFLPEMQGRGFLQALPSLLWQLSLRDPVVRSNFLEGRVFATAITQSPFILGLLRSFSRTYPCPDRLGPDADEVAVAETVTARFDPHLRLERGSFILRQECRFRYRRMPLSRDRRLNQFCAERLRYDKGDVFVIVGRVAPDTLRPYLERVQRNYGGLTEALLRACPEEAPAPVLTAAAEEG